MALSAFHPDPERIQKRWIVGALGIALVLHVGIAGIFGWYRIKGLEVPFEHSPPSGPFTIKTIEINPDDLKTAQADPIARLPAAEPPKNPSDFNLDANLVEKALQTPQPVLSPPAPPEPNKVIAAADLTQNLPYVETDAALSADIAKVQPTAISSPASSAKLAQDIINSATGPNSSGAPATVPGTSSGHEGALPGFSDLAPGFKVTGPTLSNLPEPILLRLPSDVLFDFDSATLKPEASSLLSQAVALIAKYPEANIQVDGYSDAIGKPDYNLALSQQRAEAVQAWLQEHASGGYKFKSQGHGSSNFVVSALGSIEQQQPNRRVEIVIQALKPE